MMNPNDQVIINEELFVVVSRSVNDYVVRRIGGKSAVMDMLTSKAQKADYSSSGYNIATASKWISSILKSNKEKK